MYLMQESYGVSGDVLRRLVFFIFVVRILILGHMEAISWNNEMEWSGTTISKNFCTFLLYQTNASLPLYVSALPTRQGIVTMLGLGRGGSQFYISWKFSYKCKLLLTMVSFVAVLVTNTLIRDYMINCARSFIYTTSICYANSGR